MAAGLTGCGVCLLLQTVAMLSCRRLCSCGHRRKTLVEASFAVFQWAIRAQFYCKCSSASAVFLTFKQCS
jgi:hypothetical protein